MQQEKNAFSYLRYGHAKLFKASPFGLTHKEFIESIMKERIAIDIAELEEHLLIHYGIKTLRAKITQAVLESTMYYDTSKKRVYINEETFINSNM